MIENIPHLRAPRSTVERLPGPDGYDQMVVEVMCGRSVAVTLTTYVPSKVRCPECKAAERRHTCDNPLHCSTCLNEKAAKATAARTARRKARR